jgi:hypothetical protein
MFNNSKSHIRSEKSVDALVALLYDSRKDIRHVIGHADFGLQE